MRSLPKSLHALQTKVALKTASLSPKRGSPMPSRTALKNSILAFLPKLAFLEGDLECSPFLRWAT
ncbi:hypothetical protein DSO57_1032784 [Entomophthora muscae]|uniref:Uncharacterized protein n=1 Tax=Entomophthora muscae TaxID=34485 RepID=A0ACC2RF07_9FUNG|nr:hypothetical protein DSO57_1032784 [Entomophthora muscae]